MKEHYPISIRFPEQLKAALEREAKKEDRSVSSMVRRIIERHLIEQNGNGRKK
jgi:predicted DNA-binding protein